MKKDSKVMKLATFVLLVTMIALILVANTYAKYTTSASTTGGVVTVAKWSIKVNGEEFVVEGNEPDFDFDLFSTILDTDTDAEETDVRKGMIAPGTKGAFNFTIQNTSDVNAKYTLSMTLTDENGDELDTDNLPLQFRTKTNGGDYTAWVDIADLAEFEASNTIAMAASPSADNENPQAATDSVIVEWQWVFEKEIEGSLVKNDEDDTAIGYNALKNGGATILVSTSLTVEQVD